MALSRETIMSYDTDLFGTSTAVAASPAPPPPLKMANPHPSQWPIIAVTEPMIEKAHAIRDVRGGDKGEIGGKLYDERENRWLGDLGALAFGQWLAHEGVPLHLRTWKREHAWQAPDYEFRGNPLRVRTMHHNGGPEPWTGMGLNERHRKKPNDYLFAFSVVDDEERPYLVTIVGVMTKGDLFAKSKRIRAGETLPGMDRPLPGGTDLYDVPIALMTPPIVWLCSVWSGLGVCTKGRWA
jgi:hypothetical protein